MSDIMLTSEIDTGSTLLQNSFIEDYMIYSNGEYVKVYLWLLYILDNNFISVSKIANSLNMTDNDVKRALNYWSELNILSIIINTNNSDEYKIKILNNTNSIKKVSKKQDIRRTSCQVILSQQRQNIKSFQTISSTKINVKRQQAPLSPRTSIQFSPKFAQQLQSLTQQIQDCPNSKLSNKKLKSLLNQKSDVSHSLPNQYNYTKGQIIDFMETTIAKEIIPKLELMLHKNLSKTDIQYIMYFHYNYHFSNEKILELYEHCIKKYSLAWSNYIADIAFKWFSKKS